MGSLMKAALSSGMAAPMEKLIADATDACMKGFRFQGSGHIAGSDCLQD
jgi:hypothetical protein